VNEWARRRVRSGSRALELSICYTAYIRKLLTRRINSDSAGSGLVEICNTAYILFRIHNAQ